MKVYDKNCDICGKNKWKIAYSGPIRDGAYGKVHNDALVYQCENCNIQMLSESDCIPPEFYETGEYREKLNQSLVCNSEIKEHELLNRFTFESIWPLSVRNKKILDIGCGTGSLLDAVNNISKYQVGVEPCQPYLDSVVDKGYVGYKSIEDCIEQQGQNSFDMAFSIQVIEHVLNPKLFLEEILILLKPGADLIVSTPNRDDILMSLLPDEFPSFFYRTPHRWYFDSESLEFCARSAGFEVVETKHIHRYGMANTLRWLRDKQPTGMKKIKGIDIFADSLWKAYLENTCQSDNLYIHLRVPNNL
ncbi:class I SAM-dependent methyltransferase [Candidatus Woesearchaeota archaeon]|jgi:2-polyprenyl-3-methyl-5-hydroxy-6-metoxy-1,4-benzoquinol methylase|nr:class I SAM-dependent methyltransferase [Candidatus Woesearchaeota archaeon]